jgi:hypothetical protein
MAPSVAARCRNDHRGATPIFQRHPNARSVCDKCSSLIKHVECRVLAIHLYRSIIAEAQKTLWDTVDHGDRVKLSVFKLLIVGLVVILNVSTWADTVLWSHRENIGGGSGGAYEYAGKTEIGMFFNKSVDPSYVMSFKLFDGSASWVTTADIGLTKTISSNADDPEFSSFAAAITNGAYDGKVGVYWFDISRGATGPFGPGGGSSVDFAEPIAFFNNVADPRGDRAGYRITAFTRTVVSYSSTVSGALGAESVQRAGVIDFSIRGDLLPTPATTPLPGGAAAGSVLLGGMGMCFLRRNRAAC